MILNLFKSSEEKVKLRIEKEAKNIMKEHDKYAREGALYYLKSQADNPEALVALLNRFEVNISPSTLDQREKNSIVEIFTKIDKAMAINTLKSFIKTADNVAKPCAILRELDDEACEFLISVLESIGAGYARNPEKKKILLRELYEFENSSLSARILPFLEDIDPDVVMLAAEIVLKSEDREIKETMAEILSREHESPRLPQLILLKFKEKNWKVPQRFIEVAQNWLRPNWKIDASGKLTIPGL